MLATLEPVAGYPELAPRWSMAADSLKQGLVHCRDEERGLLRDHPQGEFSLHAQVQAVLAGYWEGAAAGEVLERAMNDADCRPPATLYYRAHLAEALRRAGRGDLVLTLFDAWFGMLEAGVTTWPETDAANARSDCHGWGCMVETEIVHSLFGITPAAPGWRRIRFNPHAGVQIEGELSLLLPVGEVTVVLGPSTNANQIHVPEGVKLS
jgi:hypothetical protein